MNHQRIASGIKDIKILVTSPCYDDIGQVLRMLNLSYGNYDPTNGFECDIFFLNCGTHDAIDTARLRDFVAKGGMLYASDLTSSLISEAFPGIFNFAENKGEVGHVNAAVYDEELTGIIGNSVTIYFDLGAWSVLNSINRGKVILASSSNRKPIMVQISFERGVIFYTCFHNHAQANDKEMALLKLLIMKQLGEFKQTSIENVCKEIQTSVSDYRQVFIQEKKV